MTDDRHNNLMREFALRMGDNTLILGQQLSKWCGHAPILEEDIALSNVALDLIGQTKLWLGLAAALDECAQDADELAFLRDARAFRNCLLVEQPNGDFGQTLMRQFLFDAWHLPMLQALKASSDMRVAEIAEKSEKEVRYHLERSEDLVVRLGDGSQESHQRMQNALDLLWPFAGELLQSDDIDDALATLEITPQLGAIGERYNDYTTSVFERASLTAQEAPAPRKGGKSGLHSEHLGNILSDMQFLQRAYSGASW